MSFRSHQRDLLALVRDIARGDVPPKFILVNVTMGGGKSTIPFLAGAELIPAGFADHICNVVPRLALQVQAEEVASQQWLLNLLGCAAQNLEIRTADNTPNPSRGKMGYTTTYQSIVADPLLHKLEFELRRYILILDEFHHLDEGGAWHQAVLPLVERARLVILMTGTLERGDGKPIAFLPYRKAVTRELKVGLEPDLTPSSEMAVIQYSRTQALDEQAVRHLEFVQLDGMAAWTNRNGQDEFSEIGLEDDKTREKLWTALNTDFATQLLERCVTDPITGFWARRERWPGGKFLVVAPSVPLAKSYLKELKKLGVVRCDIAVAMDSAHALESIRRFKLSGTNPNALDALVTVQMAYEGMDVPEIINIACLTHIRSAPWIYQMVSRGNRVCRSFGPWNEQNCVIYGPNDILLTAIFDKLRAEQLPFLTVSPAEGDGRIGGDRGNDGRLIAPLWSEATDEHVSRLADNERLDPSQAQSMKMAMVEYGISGSPLNVMEFLRAYGGQVPRMIQAPKADGDSIVILPPSVREKRLRDQIEAYCRRYDRAARDQDYGWLNKEIYGRFKKSRKEMTEGELREVWVWVNDNYPLQVSYAGD